MEFKKNSSERAGLLILWKSSSNLRILPPALGVGAEGQGKTRCCGTCWQGRRPSQQCWQLAVFLYHGCDIKYSSTVSEQNTGCRQTHPQSGWAAAALCRAKPRPCRCLPLSALHTQGGARRQPGGRCQAVGSSTTCETPRAPGYVPAAAVPGQR